MEVPVTANVMLEELARLLNLWAERGWKETTAEALSVWASRSASLTPKPPVPEVALELIEKLGLVRTDSRGTVQAIPLLRQIKAAAYAKLDGFSPAVASVVFDRLLLSNEYAKPIYDVLGSVRYSRSVLRVQWSSVPKRERVNPAWIWLQQLGLASHTGAEIILNEIMRPHIAAAPVSKRSVSQAELEARLAAQKERASLAEEYVLELERTRLSRAGKEEYLDGVIRVSIENVEAGYDILSYDLDGKPRYIEVKSSVGPRQFFVLTRNERETAERWRSAYWIAWVGCAERLPDGPVDVAWYQDPAAILSLDESPWSLDEIAWRVSVVKDDSRFQTQPS